MPTRARNPMLWAAALAAQARARRLFTTRTAAAGWSLAIGLCAGALGWSAADALRAPAASLIRLLADYSVAFGALVAVHAFVVTSRRRRQLWEAQRRSWLAAAPISSRSVSAYMLAATALTAGLHIGVIAFALIALGWIAESLASLRATGGFAAIGFAAGAICGWLAPRRARLQRASSRYAPKLHASGERARLDLVSHWPIAQVFAWHRPENARLVLLFALFAVQGGSSIAVGLCVVGAWLLGIYLASVLQATMHVGRAAAQWLRATPLSFASFAWAVARRSLIHQTVGTGAGVGAVVMLGLPLPMALYMAALWLSAVMFATAVSLAESWRSRGSAVRLVFSLVVLGAIEAREQGWAIPVALALACWRVRHAGALRTARA